MSSNHHLNVFTGPSSLRDYFDPDCGPALPLVELPPSLNPYHDQGVRIYAKMMSMHPANNVKSMPAMNLLATEVAPGQTKTIVEYSSGSTVISMSMIARVFHGIHDTHAYLSNKTSLAKLRLMQFFGLHLRLFGGPSQPEPLDSRGGIQSARLQSQNLDTVINPNQYENDANWQSHARWTGPQILKQLPNISVICAGMGTSGTMTGLGTFFKQNKPTVFRLGVCTSPGDRVPGPRSLALLGPVQFPWRDSVDHIEHVGSHDSFAMSLELCRNGLICGPSSGFNLKGLFNLVERQMADDVLSELRAPDGFVHAVFICCDLPYQYIDEYFSKLGPECFPKITNEHLTKVDLYRYDESWEVSSKELVSLAPEVLIVDLRRHADFLDWHLPNSLHIPLNSLDATSPSPFFDSNLLESQWRELDDLFEQTFLRSQLQSRHLLCICYNGDTSRVATSILRAKGFEAESVKGGLDGAFANHKVAADLRQRGEDINPRVSTGSKTSRVDSVVRGGSEASFSDTEGNET